MLIPMRSLTSILKLRALPGAKPINLFIMALVLSLSAYSLVAQETPAPTPEPAPQPSAVVTLGDQTLFTIKTPIGPYTPQARASGTSTRLKQVMKDGSHNPADIHTEERLGATQIVAGDIIITVVSDADAIANSTTRPLLAESEARLMREAIIKVRGEYTTRSISLDAVYAALTTIALIVILALFRRIFPALYRLIERWRGTRLHTIKVQSLELVSEDRLVQLSLNIARVLRFTLTALLLYFYIPLVFSFFPWTRSYGRTLIAYILSPVSAGWTAFVNYLPRLLVVFVIIFFAYVALRIARVIFRELERGSITWPGFYPEWAMPTLKIVQLLIIAFAIVVAFPYLPGSDSPAFKGVSIFLGVLFSLGSSSAVSNVVAGILLTYTRAFHVGDIVQISETIGKVEEKALLATQIRTIKNVIVTIPNGLVLGSQVINFSQSSESKPLILHVTVSIGYDAPWRQIHALLIAAATRTTDILPDPAPFVLQTSLDDFYVSYQINAYTRTPTRMAAIYSELNQNIQDQFNEAGVEIMSPHYNSLRDGNTIAIPSTYRPPNYQPDSFRVSSSNPAQTPAAPPKTS